MKELELKERSSKSLLANVLDIDDDFRHVGINSSQTAIGSKYVYTHDAISKYLYAVDFYVFFFCLFCSSNFHSTKFICLSFIRYGKRVSMDDAVMHAVAIN